MAVKKDVEEKKFIFDSQNIEDINNKLADGVILKRYQNPWFKNEVGVRKAGITFKMTDDEIQEYVKCKMDIHYFAEKYCKIKVDDGTIQHIKLRDYQKDILDLFKGRKSILMASRQSGKTINAAITMLHFVTFNNDKNIMIVANIASTTIEIIDKIKGIYMHLPFFLKAGVKNWAQKSIILENGCRIKSAARSKTPAIGFTIDFLYLDEFAHIPSSIIEPYYKAVYPVVSAIENSKIIITSTPNGMNLFYRLLIDAERPDGDPLKNNYRAMRIYWQQVPGRFVTYYRLNPHKMYDMDVDKEWVYGQAQEYYKDITDIKIKFDHDKGKDVIHVTNNTVCNEEFARGFEFLDRNGIAHNISKIAEITTWKLEAIKDIGGEDAFNQEYDLRFVNATRSLLDESVIERLLNSKKQFEYSEIYEISKKLKFNYEDLKWINDPDVFVPVMRNSVSGIMSIDISEGLGQDYSVINIFKISPKPKEIIDIYRGGYTRLSDFFCLEQIAIYRSNYVSVKQLAELFYLLAFEYFNYDNFRVVLEMNSYGSEFLAHLPHIFEGNNNYGSFIFYRYKHRADSEERKIGLKVGKQKNILVKDYQDALAKGNFIITNEDNIREITTFVKHTTSAGNIKYAADIGNDDCLLPDTLVKTEDGYKKIKDVRLGELVLTHLGNYKPVTNISIKDFDGDMYRLKFRGNPELNVTYNHPIYVPKNDYSKEYRKIYNNYRKREWIYPGDLNKKSRCVIIKSNMNEINDHVIRYTDIFEKHKYSAELNFKLKEIKIDSNFSKFLGLFLADGNCYKPHKTSYRISLSFNKDQIELINEMKDILFGWGIKLYERFKNNSYTLTFYNRFLFEILINCYDENKEKVFPTLLYSKIGKENMEQVLNYWLKGDGWVSNTKGRARCQIGCSTSFQLALTMRDIAISLDKHAVISLNKRHRYSKRTKDQYWVSIYDRKDINNSSLRKISNFEYSSIIDKIEKYNYKGKTYNLEVKDDNSYVANGVVVHNCVMTIVNASSVFDRYDFREMVEEYAPTILDANTLSEYNTYINNLDDYTEGTDYSSIIKINRQRKLMKQYQERNMATKNWF